MCLTDNKKHRNLRTQKEKSYVYKVRSPAPR